MPKRGENIRKRKDGRWEGRYKPQGKSTYRSIYGKGYFEVKEKMRNVLHHEEKPRTRNIMMPALCLEWLEHIKFKVKESTYANYHTAVHSHIIPYFEKTSLRTINQQAINCFIEEKAKHGRLDGNGGLSSKTIHDLIIILNQILKLAMDKKYIAQIDYDFAVPKAASPVLDVLSHAERDLFIQSVLSNLTPEALGFLIALFTGIRIGELCALTWQDVNLDDKFIRITKTLQRIKNVDAGNKAKTKIMIGQAKSKHSIRDIPLPAFLLDILNEHQVNEDAFVITGQAKFCEPRTYQEQFKRFLKHAGLRNMNFHILRHTFATHSIELGFDIKSLSEILGHASVSFTLEKYVHSSFELKKRHMDKQRLSVDKGQKSGQKNKQSLDA